MSLFLARLRSASVFPPIELVYVSNPSWPIVHHKAIPQRPLRIAVLDSSYNPATIAHLAIASAPRPVYIDAVSGDHEHEDYDAKLLLLSITNADKQLKPTDATYEQRIEMMCEFAKDVEVTDKTGTVAVAIIDEPTFVGKSRMLQTFLRERIERLSSEAPSKSRPHPCQLTFLLGYDTLERFFAPRYYTKDPSSPAAVAQMHNSLRGFFSPREGDGSRIVCARRSPESFPQAAATLNTSLSSSSASAADKKSQSDSLTSTINDFFTSTSLPMSECVKMIDIGEDVWSVSSSDVRRAAETGEDDRWTRMVSSKVREYILKEGLYREKAKT
ncbi:hypothetical protein D9758_013117 [Tetrapyrgos nigripes]|uniref:Nucleotidylyl transferase n=1 Tax=Tetrapyrgos nigripes TaxID=182062 RepID=A0A8H5CB95_9AGAR|nr:hypothetical protein D9758_013117 [Tetrapyrgos nigripes]